MGRAAGAAALVALSLSLVTPGPTGVASAVAATTDRGGHGLHKTVEQRPGSCLKDPRGKLIVGTEGDDVLEGTRGADTIVGLGGNDVIRGMRGSDMICGGAGDDQANGGGLGDQVYGQGGDDTIYAGTGHGEDVASNDLFGGRGDDRLVGDPDEYGWSSNFIHPGPGDDVVNGKGGTSNEFDVVIMEDARRPLTVDLRAGTATGQGRDRLRGVNGVFTGPDADLILGAALANEYLSGGGGPDIIRGRRGTDYVSGRHGRDQLWGGAGVDVVEGGGGADLMVAGDGDDYLRGWHGDDRLYGGAGTDELRGGDGTDTCVSGTPINCEGP